MPYAETKQTELEENFPFQADVDEFLHVISTRVPEQEGTNSFQADMRVKPKTITAQVTVREEFEKPPIGGQQRRAASTEQSKQFDLRG